MSLLSKKWVVKNTDSKKTLMEKLLHNRNLKTEEEIDCFLNPDPSKDFHDPFLMRDMEKAVNRIANALKNHERIIIFGDYDVDGITGSAILIHMLRNLYRHFHKTLEMPKTISYRLPHRVRDGYGLREKFIKEFAALDVKVLITVDNGVSALKEIKMARQTGIDVIVTDHHTLPDKLPEAHAILHPNLPGDSYPFNWLTGAGVAFKLAKALIFKNFPEEKWNEILMPLLDLACMGTIADLGPLRGENRLIVKYGLKILENTRWPGLSRLKEYSGINGKVDTRSVGFFLGPRINAAGRIAHPHYALQLLLGEEKSAEKFAKYLNSLNQKRKNMLEESLQEALQQGEKQKKNGQRILITHHKDWHTGIIGLIAAKLVEKFGMPAIAMEDRGDILIGSARSIHSCNVIEAIREYGSLLAAFGGHAQAAGFELKKENLESFACALRKYAEKTWSEETFIPELALECELNGRDINLNTLKLLEQFEPFGFGNETPAFLIKNITLEGIDRVGQKNQHLKLRLAVSGKTFSGIGFGLGEHAAHLERKTPCNIAVELMRNEWNGTTNIEFKILDIAF